MKLDKNNQNKINKSKNRKHLFDFELHDSDQLLHSPECHILLLASNKDSWTFMCEHKSFNVFTRANRPWFIAHILQQNKPCCLQTDELNTTVHSSFNSCLTLTYKLIYKCSYKVHFFHNYKQHTKVSWQKSEADGRLAYQSIGIQII